MQATFTLTAAFLLLLTASISSAQDSEAENVRLLMNWFPQANQSGFWQAQIDSADPDDGIDIEVMSGGPRIQVIPQIAVGQADFGLADADDLMLARKNGAPVKAVFVGLDSVPYSLVYHPGQGIESIEDLEGKTVAVALGASYWEWLKKTYNLNGVRQIPLSGDLGMFANTPTMVQQGYSIFFPPRLDEVGVANAEFKLADLGYRPYSILMTSERLIESNPELVRKTVQAVQKGWQSFMANQAPATELMLPKNPMISLEVHRQAVDLILQDFLPEDPSQVGCMDPARWTELANQMKSVDLLPAGFDPSEAYDLSFLDGCN